VKADYGNFTTFSIEPLSEEVLMLRLERPERLNALTWPMVDELHAATTAIGKDPAARVVVLTGAGRGFCSGLDIQENDSLGADDDVLTVYARQEAVAGLTPALRAMPQPVIAAVNGPAAGGGLALALAADVRICTPAARFAVGFVRLGISGCDIGVSYMLPRLVGLGIAAEMMLTGRVVETEEALRTGLVNRVVEAEDLIGEALKSAEEIARNSPFGVRMTKQGLHQNVDAPSLAAAIELENRTQILAIQTEDMKEAIGAFVEKRKPEFRNR
jgi:enoyl-CoA hydratase